VVYGTEEDRRKIECVRCRYMVGIKEDKVLERGQE
jgi:hypothetical protein